MRDLTTRIPPEVPAELERVALVLEPVAAALRDLAKLTTTVELAIGVPASLDPAELAPVTETEFQHATRMVGLDRVMELLGDLERAIPDPSLYLNE